MAQDDVAAYELVRALEHRLDDRRIVHDGAHGPLSVHLDGGGDAGFAVEDRALGAETLLYGIHEGQ